MPLTFAKPGEANVIKRLVEERKQDCFLKSWALLKVVL